MGEERRGPAKKGDSPAAFDFDVPLSRVRKLGEVLLLCLTVDSRQDRHIAGNLGRKIEVSPHTKPEDVTDHSASKADMIDTRYFDGGRRPVGVKERIFLCVGIREAGS